MNPSLFRLHNLMLCPTTLSGILGQGNLPETAQDECWLPHKEVIRECFLMEENFQSTVKKSDHAFKREAGPVCSPRRQQTQEWVRKKVVTWIEKRLTQDSSEGGSV